MTQTKRCPVCRTKFEPKTSQKYCTPSCQQTDQYRRRVARMRTAVADRSCEHCGTPFRPRQEAQRFCTPTCRSVALNKARATLAPIPCVQCGEVFKPHNGAQRFCSRRCMGLGNRRPDKTCERCGGKFRAGDSAARFCSIRCAKTVDVGTRRETPEGYVIVRVPEGTPGARGDRPWMLEHRYVMQEALGRPLLTSETVHHVDDRHKDDNRLSNLQLRQGRHGRGAAFACADCGSHNVVAVDLALVERA